MVEGLDIGLDVMLSVWSRYLETQRELKKARNGSCSSLIMSIFELDYLVAQLPPEYSGEMYSFQMEIIPSLIKEVTDLDERLARESAG